MRNGAATNSATEPRDGGVELTGGGLPGCGLGAEATLGVADDATPAVESRNLDGGLAMEVNVAVSGCGEREVW